jgi:hypothetical protein
MTDEAEARSLSTAASFDRAHRREEGVLGDGIGAVDPVHLK